VVAASVRVLGVPAPPDSGVGGTEGALVVLAVTPTTARILAAAAATARLSVLIRPEATDS
jgi:Flp pilus assembly protein CpaB